MGGKVDQVKPSISGSKEAGSEVVKKAKKIKTTASSQVSVPKKSLYSEEGPKDFKYISKTCKRIPALLREDYIELAKKATGGQDYAYSKEGFERNILRGVRDAAGLLHDYVYFYETNTRDPYSFKCPRHELIYSSSGKKVKEDNRSNFERTWLHKGKTLKNKLFKAVERARKILSYLINSAKMESVLDPELVDEINSEEFMGNPEYALSKLMALQKYIHWRTPTTLDKCEHNLDQLLISFASSMKLWSKDLLVKYRISEQEINSPEIAKVTFSVEDIFKDQGE